MISIERAIEKRHTIGVIVNPIAGLGGPAGLKGSDQAEIRELTTGRPRLAARRAAAMLRALEPLRNELRLLVGPGEMGSDAAAGTSWDAEMIGERHDTTTAEDTRLIALGMVERGVELLLFVGGDGTAVDVLAAVGDRVPVIGVPAGVKMHSGVFAVAPAPAARLTDLFMHSRSRETVLAEVVDLDEAAARRGTAAPRLHGTLRVPAAERLMQRPKVRSLPSDAAAAAELGAAFRESMDANVTYIVGPGSTNSAILNALGLPHTLLGVDVVRDGGLVGADVDDRELERLVEGAAVVRVVVTPIGGQGFLFGRGNQQIASTVIARAGRDGLIVVGTESKLAGLGGRPMLVDTGDPKVDELVAAPGYLKVLTGRGQWAAYPVQRADRLGFDADPHTG